MAFQGRITTRPWDELAPNQGQTAFEGANDGTTLNNPRNPLRVSLLGKNIEALGVSLLERNMDNIGSLSSPGSLNLFSIDFDIFCRYHTTRMNLFK